MIILFLANKFINHIIISSYMKVFKISYYSIYSGFKGQEPNLNPYPKYNITEYIDNSEKSALDIFLMFS
jgi:hypothetical protein